MCMDVCKYVYPALVLCSICVSLKVDINQNGMYSHHILKVSIIECGQPKGIVRIIECSQPKGIVLKL